jgi:hypothetical protein
MEERVRLPDRVASAAATVPVRVGDADITKVLPVPVCEATEVAFPTEVIGPVKFALVTTVAAKDPVPDPVTPPVRVIVWSPELVPVKFKRVFTVATERTSTFPVPAVSRPRKESVATWAIIESVTLLVPIAVAKLPVPDPVTSPVRVIV